MLVLLQRLAGLSPRKTGVVVAQAATTASHAPRCKSVLARSGAATTAATGSGSRRRDVPCRLAVVPFRAAVVWGREVHVLELQVASISSSLYRRLVSQWWETHNGRGGGRRGEGWEGGRGGAGWPLSRAERLVDVLRRARLTLGELRRIVRDRKQGRVGAVSRRQRVGHRSSREVPCAAARFFCFNQGWHHRRFLAGRLRNAPPPSTVRRARMKRHSSKTGL